MPKSYVIRPGENSDKARKAISYYRKRWALTCGIGLAAFVVDILVLVIGVHVGDVISLVGIIIAVVVILIFSLLASWYAYTEIARDFNKYKKMIHEVTNEHVAAFVARANASRDELMRVYDQTVFDIVGNLNNLASEQSQQEAERLASEMQAFVQRMRANTSYGS